MADKEIRRLSRTDLIEIIYKLQNNEKKLNEEIEQLKKELENRNNLIANSGSLAEVLAHLDGLFTAAQKTADDYVENAKLQLQQFSLVSLQRQNCTLQ